LDAIRPLSLARWQLGRSAGQPGRGGREYHRALRTGFQKFHLAPASFDTGGFGADLWPDRGLYLSRGNELSPNLFHASRARVGWIWHADRESLSLRLRHASWRWDHGATGILHSENNTRRWPPNNLPNSTSSNRITSSGMYASKVKTKTTANRNLF